MSEKVKRIRNIDFKAFVDIFNTYGKKAAEKHVSEMYGVRYDTIVKRLRRDSEYIFDQSRDRSIFKSGLSPESTFLTVEELCKSEKPKHQQNSGMNCDEVISSLIKEKFFEISKYVTLENSSRKIILKLDAEKSVGSEIEYV